MILLKHRSHSLDPSNRRRFLRDLALGSLYLSASSVNELWADALPGGADSRLIVGELKLWQTHAKLRRLEIAFRFLEKTDLETVSVGKHLIHGERVYALVDKSPSLPPESVQFEAHRKYIDVHYLLTGQAMTGFAPVEKLRARGPYEENTDSDSYSIPKKYFELKMVPGKFAVFFPGAGHMPWCHLNGPHDLHRVVVKVQHDYRLEQ
jgi:biofilm protein TabA